MVKRILFGASYSVIEPLGLLHLSGLARDLGWERKFHLVKDHNFESFFEAVKDFKPDVVGFNVYTGNHLQLREAFEKLKRDRPDVITVVGGPHPTYFPSESLEFADYVVMSEGFGALKRILKGEARPGILPLQETEKFPHPDRETFYDDYVEHRDSPIKSIITMTGCPYQCTYCYNSSTPKDIASNMPADIADKLAKSMGLGGRLFPHNVRSVEDVVNEGKEIIKSWSTKVIYFQDDVHAFDLQKWMPSFAKIWPDKVGIPYHAQMRWEMTAQPKRLDLLCEAGCFGLTLAIESADPVVRTEVLDRRMHTDLMYKGMRDIIDRGLRVRTEQITALPYGATTIPTVMNLEADLQLIELNVDLRRKTGGPTMAWASTLAPYKGTKLGEYCKKYGHYNGNNSDVPDTFFERSVMRFPNQWVGIHLDKLKDNPNFWLDEGE
ncbi:MAG: cobalamin-dependent protein, partial [Nanoarchaeota archaeon]